MQRNNLSNIDLNLLKVLSEIERHGSVTGAADALGIGQPAVSQALSRLRETLKDDLFVRNSGGMKPTPRARELIEPIRLALGQIEETVFGAQDFDRRTAITRYKIGASDYAAALFIPKIKGVLAARMPNANLAIVRADRSDAETLLSNGAIDIALGMLPKTGKWMRSRRLFTERHVCVFNSELVSIPDEMTLDDYIAHEHMLVSLNGSPTGFVDEVLRANGLSRRVSITTPYFLQSAYLLERLPLIATLPERFVRGCSTLSTMAIRQLPFETASFDVSALWRSADEKSARFAEIKEVVVSASMLTSEVT
ncbi:MAG: LysR family transcriptional regulator [Pseudomonadota bacterium]